MPHDFGDVAPVAPIFDSRILIRDPVRHWLDVEYFEVDPDRPEPFRFDRPCLLFSLSQLRPVRLEYRRGQAQHDLLLGPNTFVLLPPDESHTLHWIDPMEVALIWIDPEEIKRFVEVEVGLPDLGHTLEERITIEDAELAAAARQICEDLRTPSVGSGIVFEALARVFLVTLVRKYAKRPLIQQASRKEIDASRYRQCVEYVLENIDRSIRVDDLANLVGMSKSHFSRAFKSATSRSPMGFVSFLRVEEAARLLTETDYQIGKIAVMCGFADQAHLTRTFQRLRNVSPSQFRRGPVN